MLRCLIQATSYYQCEIQGKQEKKIREYAKEHDVVLRDAVSALYNENNEQIELQPTDFSTCSFFPTYVEAVEVL